MPIVPKTRLANNATLSVTNTAQLVGSGTHTFASAPNWIMVTYASKACWLAETAAKVVAAADGTDNSRIYVPEGASGLVFRWDGADVYFVNATGSETPSLYLVGILDA